MNKLFLDDHRLSYYVIKCSIDPIYENNNSWKIVRSFNEFVSYIEKVGVPELISFYHDLSLDHYKPESQSGIIDYTRIK